MPQENDDQDIDTTYLSESEIEALHAKAIELYQKEYEINPDLQNMQIKAQAFRLLMDDLLNERAKLEKRLSSTTRLFELHQELADLKDINDRITELNKVDNQVEGWASSFSDKTAAIEAQILSINANEKQNDLRYQCIVLSNQCQPLQEEMNSLSQMQAQLIRENQSLSNKIRFFLLFSNKVLLVDN